MNFKKAISAISALAISVSCFAGLTITGHAADETVYFIGSAEGAETFTGYSDANKAKWSYVDKTDAAVAFGTGGSSSSTDSKILIDNVTKIDFPAADEAYTDGSYPTYIGATDTNKEVLSVKKRGGAGYEDAVATYDFGKTVGNGGKVYLTTDAALYIGTPKSTTFGEVGATSIELADADGNTVVSIPISSKRTDKSGTQIQDKLRLKGSEEKTTTGEMKFANRDAWYGYHVELVVDIDAKTATAKFNFMDEKNSGKRTSTDQEVTVAIAANSTIASLKLKINSRKQTTSAVAIDNTTLYATMPQATNSYKVSWRTDKDDADTEVKSQEIEGVAGDAITSVSTANQTVDSVRYIYDSDDHEGKTIASDNSTVVVVQVHRAGEIAENELQIVSAADNSIIVAKYGSALVEGDVFSYSIPKYATDSNNKVLAKSDDTTFTTDKVEVTAALVAGKKIEKNYTAVAAGTNAWFWDYNNGTASNGGISAKLSGGQGKPNTQLTGKEVLATVPENGTYTVEILAYSGNIQITNSTLTIFKGDALSDEKTEPDSADIIIATADTKDDLGAGAYAAENDAYVFTKENVALNEGDNLYGLAVQRAGLDYILITKTGDLEVNVETPTPVEQTLSAVDPTGSVGAPTFTEIADRLQSSTTLKVDVENPIDGVFPVVKIKNVDYALTADTVTAVPAATGNKVSYYIQFKAKSADDLKGFGEVTITYGSGDNTDTTTYNFAEEVTP